MKHSTDRILTTHVGSLPRPKDLLDLMRSMLEGRADDFEYAQVVRQTVADCLRQQADHGVDVVCDGEQSKTGFFRYINDRLDGFEPRPRVVSAGFGAEVDDFPEYYEQYFRRAMTGGGIAPGVTLACVGPVTYKGLASVQTDIDNLKTALKGVVFVGSLHARRGAERRRPQRVLRHATRSTSSRSPTRSRSSIGRSSTPASCCRSTTRG